MKCTIMQPILYMASITANIPASNPVEGATSPAAAFDGEVVAAAEDTAEEALPNDDILARIDELEGRLRTWF
jgi:hypothetical protein